VGSDDCEISWLRLANVTPLLAALPDLRVFRLKGMQDLQFKSAGLPAGEGGGRGRRRACVVSHSLL